MSSVKTIINLNNKYDRVIVLIDMDCFYCQVEEYLNPELAGKPIAVVQYNAWKGGGIIAVNYPARKKGVTRHMRGDEAKAVCPDIELVRVPNVREKADLTKYRDAGKAVANVLQTFTNLMERASVDEAYLDITENVMNRIHAMNNGTFTLEPDKLLNCYALGYEFIGEFIENISASASSSQSTQSTQSQSEDCSLMTDSEMMSDEERNMYRKSDIKLLIGGSIVNEIRAAVKQQTGYECSAGIAHNKILAKLVCGMNKPNKQTILPLKYVDTLLSTLPIQRIKGLGGKFGEEVCESLKIKWVGELRNFGKDELQKQFDEKHGSWLHLLGQGIDLEAIIPRTISKSIGCCKKFPGRTALVQLVQLTHWLTELSSEILDRIEQDESENMRRPKQMIVSYTQSINRQDISSSRCTPPNYQIPMDCNQMAIDALELIKRNTIEFLRPNDERKLNNSIKFLGLSVTKFESYGTAAVNGNAGHSIKSMFINQMAKQNNNKESKSIEIDNEIQTEMIEEEVSSVEVQKMDQDILGEEVPKDNSIIMNSSIRIDGKTIIDDEINHQSQQNDLNSFFMKLHEERKERKKRKIIIDSETSNDSCDLKFNPIERNYHEYDNNDDDRGDDANNVQMINNSESTKVVPSPDYHQKYAEFHPPPESSLQMLQLNDYDYERCNECNKKILKINMQSHSDGHFAYRLSQEQRLEFRNQSKLNQCSTLTSSPINKRLKSSQSQSQSHQCNGLNNYFKKSTINKVDQQSSSVSIQPSTIITAAVIQSTSDQLSSELPMESCPLLPSDNNNNDNPHQSFEYDKELCDECNKLISIDCIPEHKDLHLAQKINLELNPELKKNSNGINQNKCRQSPTALNNGQIMKTISNKGVKTVTRTSTTTKTSSKTKLNHQNKIKSIDSFFKSQN